MREEGCEGRVNLRFGGCSFIIIPDKNKHEIIKMTYRVERVPVTFINFPFIQTLCSIRMGGGGVLFIR